MCFSGSISSSELATPYFYLSLQLLKYQIFKLVLLLYGVNYATQRVGLGHKYGQQSLSMVIVNFFHSTAYVYFDSVFICSIGSFSEYSRDLFEPLTSVSL